MIIAAAPEALAIVAFHTLAHDSLFTRTIFPVTSPSRKRHPFRGCAKTISTGWVMAAVLSPLYVVGMHPYDPARFWGLVTVKCTNVAEPSTCGTIHTAATTMNS